MVAAKPADKPAVNWKDWVAPGVVIAILGLSFTILSSQVSGVSSRIEAIERRVAGIDEKIDRRSEATDRRFVETNQRIDQRGEVIERRLVELNQRIDQRGEATERRFVETNQRIDRVLEQQTASSAQIARIEGDLGYVRARLDRVAEKLQVASIAPSVEPASEPRAATPTNIAPIATPAQTAPATPPPAGNTAPPLISQKIDQMLASKFKGTDVVGRDDEKIGDIADIVLDKSGNVDAYVVSLGGFLGIGQKDVALPPSAFQVLAGKDGTLAKLKLNVSKDELKSFAEFKRLIPATSTGAGSTK